MGTGKEMYFLKIKGLMVPAQSNPKTINDHINQYIDKIESIASKVESAFVGNNIAEFTKTMTQIQEMLQAVFAKRLIADASIILWSGEKAGSDKASEEKCKKLLKQFTVDLLSLSIEMQKAQNLAEKSIENNYSKVEEHEEMARGLSTVSKLIDTGNYDKAHNLALDLGTRDNAANFKGLANEIKSRDYSKADKLAHTMQKEQINYLDRTGTGSAGAQKKIMSVDDRPEVLNMVSAALSKHYKVLGANSGDSAIKIMQQQQIDLFILDIDMPGMNGFELADKIQADSKYKNTPIIFFTASSSRARIKKSMEMDVRDFIVKPAYGETLLAKARKYLD